MTNLAHVHLGPGQVGLGAVVPTTRKARMEVHVIARPGSELERDQLSVVRYGDHGHAYPAEALDVATISCASQCAELDDAALREIETATGLLITTSLGCSGLRDRAKLICELVDRRPSSLQAETVVVPVEIEPGGSWVQLHRDLSERGVDCRQSMVDGLFREVGGDRTRREIHVAPDAEWLIEGDATKEVLRALERVGDARMVSDIDGYRTRRRWLVDSGLIAMAMVAHQQSRPDARVKDADRRRLVDFYAPAVRAFARRYPDDDLDARAYAQDNVQLSINHNYDTATKLAPLRRTDPMPFLKEVDRSLVEPFAAITDDGDTWPGAAAAMEALHRILINNLYSDFGDVATRRTTVNKHVDEEAAEYYGEILSRVYSKPESLRKRRELARQLKDDRDYGRDAGVRRGSPDSNS